MPRQVVHTPSDGRLQSTVIFADDESHALKFALLQLAMEITLPGPPPLIPRSTVGQLDSLSGLARIRNNCSVRKHAPEMNPCTLLRLLPACVSSKVTKLFSCHRIWLEPDSQPVWTDAKLLLLGEARGAFPEPFPQLGLPATGTWVQLFDGETLMGMGWFEDVRHDHDHDGECGLQSPSPNDPPRSFTVEVFVAVAKNAHKKGYGSMLLDWLIKESAIQGKNQVIANIRCENSNAMAVYKLLSKFSFRFAGGSLDESGLQYVLSVLPSITLIRPDPRFE